MMATERSFNSEDIIPDIKQADRFLRVLMGFKQTCFQTFASREGDRIRPAHEHGSLDKLKNWLTSQNKAGGGVYVVVNETDGFGREKHNIKKIRSVYADLDGNPLQPILDCNLKPHVIVESSNGKFHAYWRCRGVSIDEFPPIQKAIAKRFNSDGSVFGVERVMRVPGFYHIKGEPFMSRIIQENVELPYTKDKIVSGLGLKVNWIEERPGFEEENIKEKFPVGQRHKLMATVAGRLRNAGLGGKDLFESLMTVNHNRCSKPLPEVEIAKLAGWAAKKETAKIKPARFDIENEARSEKNDAPRLIRWKTLSNTTLPPSKWIVKDILPQGLILFIGKPKVGKSWLTQALSLQIATGAPVFGHFPSNRGDVCNLALEDTDQRFQSRMFKLMGGFGEGPNNAYYSNRWPRVPEAIPHLSAWAESCEQPRLLVIDTLAKIRARMSANDKFANAYDKDYAFMEIFQEFAHKHNLAVIIVHHERKMETEDQFDRGSGSAALGGAADGQWILTRKDRTDNRAILSVSGRDFESTDHTLEFDNETGLWKHVGKTDDVKKTESQTQILRAMKETGQPMAPKEISTATDINYNTVKNALFRMMEKGLVQKSAGQGHKYTITGLVQMGEKM